MSNCPVLKRSESSWNETDFDTISTLLYPPTDFGRSSHRGSYFTAGTLKAVQVALVKPVAYLSCLVIAKLIANLQENYLDYKRLQSPFYRALLEF
jgi:hypothetical protein